MKLSYLRRYIDTTLTRALKQQFQWCVENNASTIDPLRKIGGTILNTQQLSSQQAVYISLSLPLSSSTREYVFVNTTPTEDRTLLLKSRHNLEQLPKDSTDIFFPDCIQKYTKRSLELSDTCLAKKNSLFNVSTTKCQGQRR